MIQPILAAIVLSLFSLVGVFFFRNNQKLIGIERFVVPLAVGVFLSLVLFELIPEALQLGQEVGAIIVALGFISFYILANLLHNRFHNLEAVDCNRKSAAWLLLIGDSIHNTADGVILAGAFLIDPAVGVATAIGLALHEIPQEILEFGVLIRAGYTKQKAALLNLVSASSIIFGVLITLLVASIAESLVFVLIAIAAGNLLYLATSDLLPRIHGNLDSYGGIWRSTSAILIGFILMSLVLHVSHERFAHFHLESDSHHGHDH